MEYPLSFNRGKRMSPIYSHSTRRGLLLAGVGVILSGCIADGDELDQKGDIDIIIDSEPFDLSQEQFQAEYADEYAMEFHLHETSDQWYNEGSRPVTLAEGLDLLPGFEFTADESGDRLVIEDTVYDTESNGIAIVYTVNGETVDPGEYELSDGDAIVVRIDTE